MSGNPEKRSDRRKKSHEIEIKYLPSEALRQALLDFCDNSTSDDIRPLLSLYNIHPHGVSHKHIHQTYGRKKGEGRIRMTTNTAGKTTYEHTIKTPTPSPPDTDVKEKVETTTALTQQEYESIIKKLQGGSIAKTRITCMVPFEHKGKTYDMMIEIDLFSGRHYPLIFIEIENPDPDTVSHNVFHAFINYLKSVGALGEKVDISNHELAGNTSLIPPPTYPNIPIT